MNKVISGPLGCVHIRKYGASGMTSAESVENTCTGFLASQMERAAFLPPFVMFQLESFSFQHQM